MPEMLNDDLLGLLRRVVAAKQLYWDELRQLERRTAPDDDEWSDRANDSIISYIDDLAAGADDSSFVTSQHLQDIINHAKLPHRAY